MNANHMTRDQVQRGVAVALREGWSRQRLQAAMQLSGEDDATRRAVLQAFDAQTDRTAQFKRVWQHTAPDMRGRLDDGALSVVGYAKYQGGLVTAATITDAELAERLAEIAP